MCVLQHYCWQGLSLTVGSQLCTSVSLFCFCNIKCFSRLYIATWGFGSALWIYHFNAQICSMFPCIELSLATNARLSCCKSSPYICDCLFWKTQFMPLGPQHSSIYCECSPSPLKPSSSCESLSFSMTHTNKTNLETSQTSTYVFSMKPVPLHSILPTINIAHCKRKYSVVYMCVWNINSFLGMQ